MSGLHTHGVILDPDAAGELGQRVDAAILEALLKVCTVQELRQFKALAEVGKEIPSEAVAFVQAFIDAIDEAIGLLEARQ